MNTPMMYVYMTNNSDKVEDSMIALTILQEFPIFITIVCHDNIHYGCDYGFKVLSFCLLMPNQYGFGCDMHFI